MYDVPIDAEILPTIVSFNADANVCASISASATASLMASVVALSVFCLESPNVTLPTLLAPALTAASRTMPTS